MRNCVGDYIASLPNATERKRSLPNANGRCRTQTVAAVRCQSLPNAADIDKENK